MDGTGLIALVVVIGVLAVLAHLQMKKARRAKLLSKYGDAQVVEGIMRKSFWQGMTVDMLVDSLGRPQDIGTRVLRAKTVHTYKYNRSGKNRYRTRITLENGFVVGWDQK